MLNFPVESSTHANRNPISTI